MSQEKKHDEVYKALKACGANGWGSPNGTSRQSSWIEALDEVFKKVQIQGNKVLELGSGAGDASIVLAQRGFDVTGVEFSQTAVQWAIEKAEKLKLNITFIHNDVTSHDFLEDETFDFILDGNCLHCLFGEQRNAFYYNVKRLLKSNGYLFISSVIKKTSNDLPAKVGPIERCFLLENELKDEIKRMELNLVHYWVNERENHNHFCGIISK